MKAKKIDLSRYATLLKDEKGELAMFDVRASLVNLLFHPALKLDATQVLERDDLANLVRNEETETLLVSEDDYTKIVDAVNCGEGYGEKDVEFLRRTLKAPEVTVEEPAETPAE